MTRVVGLFAAGLLAASLGVRPGSSTSGLASRQNNATIQAPASNLSTTTTGCPVGSALVAGSLQLAQNQTDSFYRGTGNPRDLRAHLGPGVEVTGEPMPGTPIEISAEPGSDRPAKPAAHAAAAEEGTWASASATNEPGNKAGAMGRSREKRDSSDAPLLMSASTVLSDSCEPLPASRWGASSGDSLGATDESSVARLFASPGANSSAEGPAGEPSPDDQAGQTTGENLPQTSNVLPLLGLVGVGSLIAGFFMRR